jgi:hypothetical protein
MINFLESVKDSAIESGFSEVTVSVLNSYANELFKLGYDLIQPHFSPDSKALSPAVGLTCRAGDFSLSIIVSQGSNGSAKMTLCKVKDREEWTYSVLCGPGLFHFSQLLSSFPAVR